MHHSNYVGFRFRFRYNYASTKGLVRSGLPQKIIGLYCDLLFICLVFVFVKPRKQTHVRERGGYC